MPDQRMKIVVTGAAGRIGRVVAPFLAEQGHDVVSTDVVAPEGVHLPSFCKADMIDAGAMLSVCAGADAVLHLAGKPGNREWPMLEQVNVTGTRTVFEAAVTSGVRRIVYASTNHVCGFNAADAWLDERTPVRPDSPYGVTKMTGELLLSWLCDAYGITGASIRIGSFLPEPTEVRHLRTWLSPRDMASLADACLRDREAGHRVVWGFSGNSQALVDLEGWNDLGYHPQDNAEDYAARLRTAGPNMAAPDRWPYLGGNLAVHMRDGGAGADNRTGAGYERQGG